MMIRIALFSCFLTLTVGLAIREKQIKLEDIERDNLANERNVKLGDKLPVPNPYVAPPQPEQIFQSQLQYNLPNFPQQQQSQFYPQPQGQSQGSPPFPDFFRYVQPQFPQFAPPVKPQQKQLPTKPKFQFGFKPMKTAPNYPQEYEQTPPPPQLSGAPQQFATPQQEQLEKINEQQEIQQQQFINSHPSQITHPEQPQYVQYYQPEQYLEPSKAQLYVSAKNQYQNVDLIADNHLQNQNQDRAIQQYYGNQQQQQQQYVYLTPSASTSIQQVVDPKGQIQYVMYVPQYYTGAKADGTQNVETLVEPQTQNYQGSEQVQYQYVPVADTQYQAQPQEPSEVQPTPTAVPQAQPQLPQLPQGPPPKFDLYKHQPKSLLDSYIPSYLQIQFYKQQQQNQANAIRQSLKPPQEVVGKTDAIKQYVPNYETEGRLQRTPPYSPTPKGKFVGQASLKRPRYLNRPVQYSRTTLKH